MRQWVFLAFICLALGQLSYSWPVNNQNHRYYAMIGRAEAQRRSWPSFREQLRQFFRNNEENDELNLLQVFESRGAGDDTERQVFNLTNIERQKGHTCGGVLYPAAPPFQWNDNLGTSAHNYAEYMLANLRLDHTSLDGTTFSQRMENAGYTNWCAAAENIACYSTPEDVVAGWLNSPGHCTNIMNGDYKDIGVGYAVGGPCGGYWAQNFGTKC